MITLQYKSILNFEFALSKKQATTSSNHLSGLVATDLANNFFYTNSLPSYLVYFHNEQVWLYTLIVSVNAEVRQNDSEFFRKRQNLSVPSNLHYQWEHFKFYWILFLEFS